jgi:dephospho-CoA kinase
MNNGTVTVEFARYDGPVYVIALTGGIASGKSLIGARLAELGAVHVDADVLAREVVEPGTAGLAAIEHEFGASVIAADGSLDRPALGAIIFADAAKRARLNAITHPAVWARAKELFAAAEARDPHSIVLYDVPLLVEAAGDRPLKFDLVVVVDAALETRMRRMIEFRGMTRAEAESRLRSQASDADRLAIADVVIDNNGSIAGTLQQVDQLWDRVRTQA